MLQVFFRIFRVGYFPIGEVSKFVCHSEADGPYFSAMTQPRLPSIDLLHLHGEAHEAFHEKAVHTTRTRFGRDVFVRGVVEVSQLLPGKLRILRNAPEQSLALERFRADHERLAELLIHHRPASMTDVNIQAGEDPIAVREVVLPLIQTLRRETDFGA